MYVNKIHKLIIVIMEAVTDLSIANLSSVVV